MLIFYVVVLNYCTNIGVSKGKDKLLELYYDNKHQICVILAEKMLSCGMKEILALALCNFSSNKTDNYIKE